MEIKAMTDAVEWEWMVERTAVIACADTQGVVAYRGGAIAAMCVADSFTVDGCCVHLAIDDPLVLRGGFLEEISRHLFVSCSRKRLFGLVPSNNAKALKFDKHIGFTEVARIPNAIRTGVDYVVMVMEREDCRWLPKEMREAA